MGLRAKQQFSGDVCYKVIKICIFAKEKNVTLIIVVYRLLLFICVFSFFCFAVFSYHTTSY